MVPRVETVRLDDKYALGKDRVLLSGTQALVRLPLMQRARDAAAGLNTAGYISGYRGSPLGGYDLQLLQQRERLAAAGIRFEPGVNEDLAATAIWGTQQVTLLPGARVDGVFAIWYGKGPGVDRAGDPIKHANRMGTSAHGGVLLVFGDDHAGKSSTIAYQSEPAVAANGLPVLYPANVAEFLEFGLHGFALSRFSGTWVGFKCINETIESTATVDLPAGWPAISLPPDAPLPPQGVHARHSFDPLADDSRLQNFKLPRAQAYVRHNRLDRIVHPTPHRRFGIVAAGKSYLDVEEALALAGLDEARLGQLGISVYKPALIWPLEPSGLVEFASGCQELLFVEEKSAFIESQAARILYDLPDGLRPRISGKRTAAGEALLPLDAPIDPGRIAQVLIARLTANGISDAALSARLGQVMAPVDAAQPAALPARTPYFCSGCPHNTSTRVPEGSLALAGIGCHTMVLWMNRRTLPPTQMGGEGANWCGIAPFTGMKHVFQNLGDGTYFHSGLLAIRAAVTSGINITYKILLNDAVAMTGGQAVEGGLSAADIAHQLRAERVQRIAWITDRAVQRQELRRFPAGASHHRREDLDAVQRELREVSGVSAILYEQTCAAEKRRRRKRKAYPDPPRRVFINAQVCEGCGDCSVQSNCVSVEPLETPFGRKRRIDQSSCNKDYSCLNGFCPSFVTVEAARPRRPAAAELPALEFERLPDPRYRGGDACQVLIAGIGGTGVVTIGAVLAMAAHLEGRSVNVYDVTGLAQKGGAVFSHVKFSPRNSDPRAPRIGAAQADVVLGCDLLVTAGIESLRCMAPGRSAVVLNSHLIPTGAFQLDPDTDFKIPALQSRVRELAGERMAELDATQAARRLLGDPVGTNMLMVGFALQSGLLPVSLGALREAVRLNGAAVELNLRALEIGRLLAHDPQRPRDLSGPGEPVSAAPAPGQPDSPGSREACFRMFEQHLCDYQDASLATRYRALVERCARAEEALGLGRGDFGQAVARGYHQVLSYKDEYEVARLHTSAAFRQQLGAAFEEGGRLRFHFAPPLLARRDARTGAPVKREFGAWVTPILALLARGRRLRGSPWDPFGYTAERRLERRLIAEYEARIEQLLSDLTPARHAIAVQLALLPLQVRGFGHVKLDKLRAARERERQLLEQWEQASSIAAVAAL